MAHGEVGKGLQVALLALTLALAIPAIASTTANYWVKSTADGLWLEWGYALVLNTSDYSIYVNETYTSDTYIHVVGFPPSSTIYLYNSTAGGLVEAYTVRSGDDALDLANGTYDVVAYVHVEGGTWVFTLCNGSLIEVSNDSVDVIASYSAGDFITVDGGNYTQLVIHNGTKASVTELNGTETVNWSGCWEVHVNLVPATSSVHIHIMHGFPDVTAFFSMPAVTSFYTSYWGALAYAIPLLVPVSVYVKTRSAGLTAAALAIVSAVWVTTGPLRTLAVAALALSVGYLLYRFVWGTD